MNKRNLSIIGLIVLGVLLFWGGAVYGQSQWNNQFDWTGMDFQPGNMMDGHYSQANGFGMMGGVMSGSMMGSFNSPVDVDPLSIEDAETAVSDYLAALNQENLELGEIMIFDNHAYAQILDTETGQGAFEVLVDPVTGNVLPEPGPNMMWNIEYGHMSGAGGYDMMGGMMGGYGGMMGGFGYAPDVEISVTPDEAVDIAQRYLDATLSGTTAGETADPFPGYYTLHVLEDGEITGMLSVNAYTGQVFLHHWHGDFVEMTGEGHE